MVPEDEVYQLLIAIHKSDTNGDFPSKVIQAHLKIVNEYLGARFTQHCHPDSQTSNGFVVGLSRVLYHIAEAYGVSLFYEELK